MDSIWSLAEKRSAELREQITRARAGNDTKSARRLLNEYRELLGVEARLAEALRPRSPIFQPPSSSREHRVEKESL
jgi:hypothetical protein